jgi:hypothetical protein
LFLRAGDGRAERKQEASGGPLRANKKRHREIPWSICPQSSTSYLKAGLVALYLLMGPHARKLLRSPRELLKTSLRREKPVLELSTKESYKLTSILSAGRGKCRRFGAFLDLESQEGCFPYVGESRAKLPNS